jgi:hypothetical protein
VSTFTVRGLFIGVNGTSTDLRGWFGARWRPSGQATWPAGWVERPPPTRPSPHVDVWQPRLGRDRLNPCPAGQGVGSALGPTRPGVWPTWSTCQIHPRGDDDFNIWSSSLCHPLKCSNFIPKFLKSNKH